jgi:hypothetical protein
MYSRYNRQYILKKSSGSIWNIYSNQRFDLYASMLSGSNTWSSPLKIADNAHEAFCACIDDDDRLTVLFQDREGSMFRSVLENDSVNTLPVLKSRQKALYDKQFQLIPLKGQIHVLFTVQHNDSWILSHQVLTGKDLPGTPAVIDYVASGSSPYAAAVDRQNNIFVFYQLPMGNSYQIGYKKYVHSKGFWGEFTPVTPYNRGCEYPSAAVDSSSTIHLCYQRQPSRQYELVYQQKFPDKNLWTKELVIHSSAYPFENSSLMCIDSNIIIFWVREGIIYYTISKDGGSSWKRPSKYDFPAGRQLMCVAYRTNEPYEKSKVYINDIPGTYLNGIRLAFYQAVGKGIASASADELKSAITDKLAILENSIEQLKQSGEQIREEVLRLKDTQARIEKEIVKYGVRLGMCEEYLNTAKNQGSSIKSLAKSMEAMRGELELLKSSTGEEKNTI